MISPLCFSYLLVFLQTSLPIHHIQPAQVLQFRLLRLSVSPGGFIPDAANTSGPA
jgi:hypothetical protein